MSLLRLRAPAKTNLFLEVRGRRPDGFHELDTVFAELDLADELELWPADGPGLALEIEGDAGLSAGPDNLVVRAADALRVAAGRPELGARARLRKRIPQGGGLGGGSSDAAAALRGLDRLWGLDLGLERLSGLAAELGSDVAFFLRGGLQRGTGRGELLEPLAPPPREQDLVLVLPPFPSPTPAVYRALAPYLPREPRGPEAVLAALASGSPEQLGAAWFNRLEEPACSILPALAEVRAQLAAAPEARGVLLSGSGSTYVVLCAGPEPAAALAARLAGQDLRALATRTACGA